MTLSATFLAAWRRLLDNEGGYSDNPSDTGGKTMWGVTEAVARAHGYTGDMRDLPQSTAMQIAHDSYWTAIRGDDLPVGITFDVLDAAYNSGPRAAIEWLQAAVCVKQDGIIGPQTLSAARDANPYITLCRFNGARLLDMTGFKAWPMFGRGWARRIANNMMGAQ